MEGVDLFSHASVDKYAAAVRKAESQGINVRALWLCNPHNPLGISYENGASQGVGELTKPKANAIPVRSSKAIWDSAKSITFI